MHARAHARARVAGRRQQWCPLPACCMHACAHAHRPAEFSLLGPAALVTEPRNSGVRSVHQPPSLLSLVALVFPPQRTALAGFGHARVSTHDAPPLEATVVIALVELKQVVRGRVHWWLRVAAAPPVIRRRHGLLLLACAVRARACVCVCVCVRVCVCARVRACVRTRLVPAGSTTRWPFAGTRASTQPPRRSRPFSFRSTLYMCFATLSMDTIATPVDRNSK